MQLIFIYWFLYTVYTVFSLTEFLVNSLKFSVYRITLPAYRNYLTSSFPICMLFGCLSCLIALTRTSSDTLKWSEHLWLVPDLAFHCWVWYFLKICLIWSLLSGGRSFTSLLLYLVCWEFWSQKHVKFSSDAVFLYLLRLLYAYCPSFC